MLPVASAGVAVADGSSIRLRAMLPRPAIQHVGGGPLEEVAHRGTGPLYGALLHDLAADFPLGAVAQLEVGCIELLVA